MYCLGILMGINVSLTKFDSVIITRKEKDAVYVWNQRLFTSNSMRLKKLDVEKPAKPPKEEEEEGLDA
jgi:hypothetical protein